MAITSFFTVLQDPPGATSQNLRTQMPFIYKSHLIGGVLEPTGGLHDDRLVIQVTVKAWKARVQGEMRIGRDKQVLKSTAITLA